MIERIRIYWLKTITAMQAVQQKSRLKKLIQIKAGKAWAVLLSMIEIRLLWLLSRKRQICMNCNSIWWTWGLPMWWMCLMKATQDQVMPLSRHLHAAIKQRRNGKCQYLARIRPLLWCSKPIRIFITRRLTNRPAASNVRCKISMLKFIVDPSRYCKQSNSQLQDWWAI